MILVSSGAVSYGQTPRWLVRGEAIVACPCRVPCPCRSNARPSQPHCENLSYVRVVQGQYEKVKLDQLQYVWTADECTGGNHPRKPTVLYFPRTATPKQIDAVERIMTGESCSGAKPSGMRSSSTEMSALINGSRYLVKVRGKVELDVDIAPGPMPMEPLPALDLWGNTVTYARNISVKVNDPAAALKWDYSGLQANYRTFETTSDFADKGVLLGLFRDDTGGFNQTQRSLIRELHLEVPLSLAEFQQMLEQVRVASRSVPPVTRSDAFGSLGGTVLDPNQNPRSGARIELTSLASGFTQIAVTNPNGRYFLAHVPVGSYQVCGSTWDGKTFMRDCAEANVGSGQIAAKELHLVSLPATTKH